MGHKLGWGEDGILNFHFRRQPNTPAPTEPKRKQTLGAGIVPSAGR